MSTSLAERLVGAWVLESYEADDPDGTVRTPFGPDATGLLVYGADGRMTVQVMDPRRPPWERRAVTPDGDRLRLTAQPLEVAGRTTIPRLPWRRAPPQSCATTSKWRSSASAK